MTTHNELERGLTTVRALYRRAVEDGDRELEPRLRPVERAILSSFPNTPADGWTIGDVDRVVQEQARQSDDRSHALDARERLLNSRESSLKAALERAKIGDEPPLYELVYARVLENMQSERHALEHVKRQRDAERNRWLEEHRARMRQADALAAGLPEPQQVIGAESGVSN